MKLLIDIKNEQILLKIISEKFELADVTLIFFKKDYEIVYEIFMGKQTSDSIGKFIPLSFFLLYSVRSMTFYYLIRKQGFTRTLLKVH